MDISIHALREEGDLNLSEYVDESWQFLSTPSARRATGRGQREPHPHYISIHALREEGDSRTRVYARDLRNISIHALREEGDRGSPQRLAGHFPFLSTPSARRATAKTEKNISAFVSL